MGGSVYSVAFGRPATDLLARLVAGHRDVDPFAPITVVAPSTAAGTTLRRALAERAGGLVGVDVVAFPRFARTLAGPRLVSDGRPPLPAALSRAHLRAVLRRHGDALAVDTTILRSPATERALERTIDELAPLDDAALQALARRGGTTAAAVGLLRHWRRATADFAVPADHARVASLAVADGAPAPDVVILHLPRRLGSSDLALLGALAERDDVELAVTVGRTGNDDADTVADTLLGALAAFLGPPVAVDGEVAPALPATIVRAPDPTEEAAMAAREVVAAVTGASGRALRPDRVAIVSRVRDPYATAVHDQLDAAGVVHHAPSTTTLGQTAPGRALVTALEVAAGGFRRADVAALLRAAPIVQPATGARVPAAWWARLAREAGVVRGVDQWRERLAAAADARRLHLVAEGTPDEEIEAHPVITGLAELGAFIDDLDHRLRPPDPTWKAWSAWALGLLDGLLRREVSRQEPEAWEAVRVALTGLAVLDGVDEPPDLERFQRALQPDLERPHGSHGRFGHGVLVGRLVDVVGADLDLVVVVGGAEGRFPPRRRDDALVPDRDRAAAGGALPPRGLRREEEHRDLRAALASGARAVLTVPRSDPREQRERQPAPWVLEAATGLAGTLVGSDDLDHVDAEWLRTVPSFEAWVAGAGVPSSPQELDLEDLLADHRARRPLSEGVVAAGDPVLAAGLAAATARRAGSFDEFSGHVGLNPALLEAFDRPRSPTGLERYAQCPFKFFLADVLRVGRFDDPTEGDLISPIDEGNFVHEVLETFIGEALGKPPDEPWSDLERDRILEIAEAIAARFVGEGRTGRPLLWGVRWEQLRHQLLRFLDRDQALRRELDVSPVAVELPFGAEGEAPVELDVGGRRLAFKGVIDRVDRSPDGRRLVVYDYKTGKPDTYKVVAYDGDVGDLTAKGTKLQLPIYALAARTRWPDAETIHAQYWFVGRKGEGRLYGGPFDAAAEVRFGEVVTTVLDGVGGGRFPANPGADDWRYGQWTHDNCGWCEYDRVCPTSRGEAWVRLRTAPELADYVRLADERDADDEEVGT